MCDLLNDMKSMKLFSSIYPDFFTQRLMRKKEGGKEEKERKSVVHVSDTLVLMSYFGYSPALPFLGLTK